MRVAIVYRNFQLDGSLERDTVLFARELVRLGFDVHCYCNPATRTAEAPGVTFHDVVPVLVSRSRLGYPVETLSFAVAATQALRGDRPAYDVVDVRGVSGWEHDVVTVHGVTRAHQRRWIDEGGRDFRLPRLRAAVAPLTGPQLAAARTIERLQFRRGRYLRVAAVTPQVRDDLVEVHGVPPELIDVNPLGVDVAACGSLNGDAVRRQLGIGERPLLLFVGHDFARKGLDVALETLPALPDAHLVVVGRGDVERYRCLAATLGVAARCHFVGATRNPEIYYREATVFVLPTRNEPWGLTLVEAMAAGVPVVTSSAAGAASVIRTAGAGVLLDDVTAPPLLDAVAGLLADPERRREMGARGRRAAGAHSAAGHAEAMVATYRRALAGAAR